MNYQHSQLKAKYVGLGKVVGKGSKGGFVVQSNVLIVRLE
jgi:hypothetical protein